MRSPTAPAARPRSEALAKGGRMPTRSPPTAVPTDRERPRAGGGRRLRPAPAP